MQESNLARSFEKLTDNAIQDEALRHELAQFVSEELPVRIAANAGSFRKRRLHSAIRFEDRLFKLFRVY